MVTSSLSQSNQALQDWLATTNIRTTKFEFLDEYICILDKSVSKSSGENIEDGKDIVSFYKNLVILCHNSPSCSPLKSEVWRRLTTIVKNFSDVCNLTDILELLRTLIEDCNITINVLCCINDKRDERRFSDSGSVQFMSFLTQRVCVILAYFLNTLPHSMITQAVVVLLVFHGFLEQNFASADGTESAYQRSSENFAKALSPRRAESQSPSQSSSFWIDEALQQFAVEEIAPVELGALGEVYALLGARAITLQQLSLPRCLHECDWLSLFMRVSAYLTAFHCGRLSDQSFQLGLNAAIDGTHQRLSSRASDDSTAGDVFALLVNTSLLLVTDSDSDSPLDRRWWGSAVMTAAALSRVLLCGLLSRCPADSQTEVVEHVWSRVREILAGSGRAIDMAARTVRGILIAVEGRVATALLRHILSAAVNGGASEVEASMVEALLSCLPVQSLCGRNNRDVSTLLSSLLDVCLASCAPAMPGRSQTVFSSRGYAVSVFTALVAQPALLTTSVSQSCELRQRLLSDVAVSTTLLKWLNSMRLFADCALDEANTARYGDRASTLLPAMRGIVLALQGRRIPKGVGVVLISVATSCGRLSKAAARLSCDRAVHVHLCIDVVVGVLRTLGASSLLSDPVHMRALTDTFASLESAALDADSLQEPQTWRMWSRLADAAQSLQESRDSLDGGAHRTDSAEGLLLSPRLAAMLRDRAEWASGRANDCFVEETDSELRTFVQRELHLSALTAVVTRAAAVGRSKRRRLSPS